MARHQPSWRGRRDRARRGAALLARVRLEPERPVSPAVCLASGCTATIRIDAAPKSTSNAAILVSSNRRLAVIDGAFVGIGDRVGRRSVVSTAVDAVYFREPSGLEVRAPIRVRR